MECNNIQLQQNLTCAKKEASWIKIKVTVGNYFLSDVSESRFSNESHSAKSSPLW